MWQRCGGQRSEFVLLPSTLLLGHAGFTTPQFVIKVDVPDPPHTASSGMNFRSHRYLSGLRALLVALALLCHGVSALAHDHDAPPGGQHTLCAVCVYGSDSGGALNSRPSPTVALLPRVSLVADVPIAIPSSAPNTVAIRGPPLPL